MRLQERGHSVDPVLDSEVVDPLFSRLDRIDAERDDHDTMIKRNGIERNVERVGHMLEVVRLTGHDDHHHWGCFRSRGRLHWRSPPLGAK